MKKSVGLLTCYIENCGANLQAYALQQTIIKLGYCCEIVKYTQPYGYAKRPIVKRIVMNKPVLFALSLLMGQRFKTKYLLYKRELMFRKFRKKLIFGRTEYSTENSIMTRPPNYDMFVCGSDQIWNPTFYNGNNHVYHLDFVPKEKKRIAYAPSIGVSEIPKKYEQDFISLIRKYDYLSVREQQGASIVKELSGVECPVVLDPTLLLDRTDWMKITSKPKFTKPYVLLYLFGDRPFIGEFVEHIKSLTDMNIAAIPFNDRELKAEYCVLEATGPAEFVSLIANAAIVITDSFHATAFSINLHVPFYTVLRDDESNPKGMNSRITGILGMTGLSGRLVASRNDFPTELDTDVDFSFSDEVLMQKRETDIAYLSTALKAVK